MDQGPKSKRSGRSPDFLDSSIDATEGNKNSPESPYPKFVQNEKQAKDAVKRKRRN